MGFIKYTLSQKGGSAHSSLKCSKENIKDREGKQKFFLLLIENIVVVYQLLRLLGVKLLGVKPLGVKLLGSLISGL